MADAAAEPRDVPVKRSKMPLFLGLGLALAGGGGGYFAVSSGLFPGGESHEAKTTELTAPAPLPDVQYVPIDPLVISLTDNGRLLHLRFQAQIEVDAKHAEEVRRVTPRVVDVLNTYLRALDIEDIQHAQALTRLRAQMLRRIQIVVGEGRARDLLIMEFVLS